MPARSNIKYIVPNKVVFFFVFGFFNRKVLIAFLFLDKNIWSGYSLEGHQQGTSNKYPQHMSSLRNKNNTIWIQILFAALLICSITEENQLVKAIFGFFNLALLRPLAPIIILFSHFASLQSLRKMVILVY